MSDDDVDPVLETKIRATLRAAAETTATDLTSNSGLAAVRRARRRPALWIAVAAAAVLALIVIVSEPSGQRLVPADDTTTLSDSISPDPSTIPSPAVTATSTTATFAPAITAEATSTVATSAAPLDRSSIILRGDGLGLFAFGAPKDQVVATLTAILGTPGADSGPPLRMTTPGRNGCVNRSDTAVGFAEVVVGFSDHGDGTVFDAWTASLNGVPTTPTVGPAPFATVEALPLGATVADAEAIYGSSYRPAEQTGWEWVSHLPVGVVDSAGGSILLAGLARPAQLDLFTAGINCSPDPSTVVAVGPDPIGLKFDTVWRNDDPATPEREAGSVIVNHDTRNPTEWTSHGGRCVEGCAFSIAQIGPSDGDIVILWAARSIGDAIGDTTFEVTDSYPMQPGTSATGTWDCGRGLPIVNTANEIITLLDVDVATGKFFDDPNLDGCVTVGG